MQHAFSRVDTPKERETKNDKQQTQILTILVGYN